MIEQNASPPAPPCLAWTAPNETFCIQLHSSVVTRLNHELQRAPKMSQRGTEVGGILRGTVGIDGGMRVLFIQGIEPISCTYSRGSTWTLSPEERIELHKHARGSRGSEPPMEVLGFYRSNTRPNPGPSDDDLQLYFGYFPEPHAIVMIVQRVAGANLEAHICYREGGTALTALARFGDGPLPELPPTAVRVGSPAGSPPPPYQPVPTALPVPAPVQHSETRWMLPLALGFGAVLTIAIAALGLLAFNMWHSSATERSTGSSLSLQVEKRSDQLLITWDPASRKVASARRGRLSVRDGGYSRNVELSANQVRSGRLFYLTATNDVELRLEIEQEDGHFVGESVSFVAALPGAVPGAAPGPLPGASPGGPPGSAPLAMDSRSRKTGTVERFGNITPPEASRTALDKPPSPDPAAKAPSAAKLISPPETAPETPAKTPAGTPATKTVAEIAPREASSGEKESQKDSHALEPPPPIAAAGDLKVAIIMPENRQAQLQPPKSAQPATLPHQAGAGSAEPPADAVVAPPEPIRQVSPVVPQTVRQAMHGRVTIEVRVSIDDTGKVTRANVGNMQGTLAGFLSSSVLNAARQWQFKPARANGHPVPSEKTLVFSFSGK